ncbi:unnamed protein product, partial [marine sediment metagenome]
CKIPKGEKGYCGLRKNVDDKIIGPTKNLASLSFYHDNLPTNCVANWVCPGGTGTGFPKHISKVSEIRFDSLLQFLHTAILLNLTEHPSMELPCLHNI